MLHAFLANSRTLGAELGESMISLNVCMSGWSRMSQRDRDGAMNRLRNDDDFGCRESASKMRFVRVFEFVPAVVIRRSLRLGVFLGRYT
jgi:hypothetical protein